MKKLAVTVALMCALSTLDLRGNMPTVGVVGQAPPTISLGETSAPPEAGEPQGTTLLER